MLTQADFVVLTKIDMVSQAELEIISWQIRQINPGAALFPVDGLAGYGTDLLARWLLDRPACGSFEGDILRHTDAQRGLLLLRGRAACGQRIPAGRGGQDQL